MSSLGKRKDRDSQDHGSTLFVSNLPFTVTSTDLKTLFSDIAPVRNAFVVLEHASGASKGVGYVSFAIKEDAELALTKVTKDGLKVDGRGIRVQWAENKPKQGEQLSNFIPTPAVKDNKSRDPVAIRSIVISGLPPSIDAKSLWKKIRKLDGAEKIDWPLTATTGEEDPTSARALFSTPAFAQEAVQKLHAHIFKGSIISATLKKRLDAFQSPSAASNSKPILQVSPSRASRLIIRNLPFDIKEQDVMATFLPYGPIHSIELPLSDTGRSKGFAFVWMLSKKDAEKALQICNGMKIRAGIAEDLGRMKQKKKKELRVEKKLRTSEKLEDQAQGTERVMAVDWALSKNKWEEEKVKLNEEDATMDDVETESESDDDESIGVNEEQNVSANEEAQSDSDQPNPGKPELPPPEAGTTLFVRNVPFEATEEEFRQLFRAFGPLRYARITLEPITGRSRGTGFVCFWSLDDADKVVEQSEILRLESTGGNEAPKANPFKLPSILTPDPSSSLAQSLVLHGRTLDVVRAVTRNEATKLKENGERQREKSDKRNLYLLREGVILPNTPAAETLGATELEKRTQSFNTRRALLKSNPSLYVSRTRLSIRQLPGGVTEHMLKRLANYAIREFEQEVKKGHRNALDPEELEGPLQEEEQKAMKKTKTSRKVKQTKIIRQQDRVDPITGKGKSKGYGFLELFDHADALRVLRWANNNLDLASLWSKWWKEEVNDMIKDKVPLQEDEKDVGIKTLKEEKDDSKRWNTKGSLIVEFSIENVQVTKRRKLRESEMGRDPPNRTKTEDERPLKRQKIRDGKTLEDEEPERATQAAKPNKFGSLIGRKRKQRKERS